MKRTQLEEVLRRKVRLKISSKKRGRFAINLVASGSLVKWESFPNKRTALTALYTRMRLMPDIVIECKQTS